MYIYTYTHIYICICIYVYIYIYIYIRREMPAERARTLGACTHTWDDRFLIYSLAPLKAAWILCNGSIRHARLVCHFHTVHILEPSFDSFTLNYILSLQMCFCLSLKIERECEYEQERANERKKRWTLQKEVDPARAKAQQSPSPSRHRLQENNNTKFVHSYKFKLPCDGFVQDSGSSTSTERH